MGLFNKIKNPVQGTAQVVGCSAQNPEDSALFRTQCRMNVVLKAPGIEPVSVEKLKWVPGRKHPYPGMVLPVTLDSSNPENFDINWDEVPTHREASRQRADQTAAAMAAGDESDSGAIVEQLSEMFPGATIQVEGSSAGTLSPDAMDAIRSALGGEAGTSADDGDDDRIKALERLAKLHQAGALTDEEFAAEKSRLLGG